MRRFQWLSDTCGLPRLLGIFDTTRPTYYNWPNQGDPAQKDWDLWRRALAISFCGGQERRLATYMGSWLDNQIDKWKWFFAPTEDRLYERTEAGWNAYSMEGGRTQRVYKRFIFAGITETAPNQLLRATVYALNPGRFVLSGFGLDSPTPNDDTPTPSLAEAIEKLPQGSRWAVERFDTTDNGMRIAQAIRDGTAIAISDGSFKDGFGTSALKIEAADSTDNIIAVNVVPGNTADQGAYRSELAGIFGQVVLVNTICKVHNISQGAIECGCDGEGAITKVFSEEDDANTDGSQFDLLSATRAALKASPIKWTFRHVKGHQDDILDATLDRWALLNIEMDSLAKMHWLEKSGQQQPLNSMITGEYWPVFIDGRKIHSNLWDSLYEEIYRIKMATHWEKHDRLDRERSMLVNWEACAVAMKRLKISRRHWIAKHSEGMCGVGKWLVIWQERETEDCPRCSEFEDARHVWLCQEVEAKCIRKEGISSISRWMEETQTAPEIRAVIKTRMSQWSDGRPMPPIQTNTAGLQDALHAQDAIGWDNFFEGCIAKEWEQVQDAHYKWCRSRKSGRRWTIALIQKLWDVAWDLWEHRNGIVHAKENAEALEGMAAIDDEIRSQFQWGHYGLQQRDHYLVNGSVDGILAASIVYRQRWLQCMDSARARASRRQADTYGGERQVLLAWLHGGNGNQVGNGGNAN
mgnify:CR=1 FL=1